MNCPNCKAPASSTVVGWDICGDVLVWYCEKCGWNEDEEIEERANKLDFEMIWRE